MLSFLLYQLESPYVNVTKVSSIVLVDFHIKFRFLASLINFFITWLFVCRAARAVFLFFFGASINIAFLYTSLFFGRLLVINKNYLLIKLE